jgi:hypothetical protein
MFREVISCPNSSFSSLNIVVFFLAEPSKNESVLRCISVRDHELTIALVL